MGFFFNCSGFFLGQSWWVLYKSYLDPSLDHIANIVNTLFYPLPILMAIPIDILFKVVHHHSSETLCSFKIENICKSKNPNEEACYLGSKSGINSHDPVCNNHCRISATRYILDHIC